MLRGSKADGSSAWHPYRPKISGDRLPFEPHLSGAATQNDLATHDQAAFASHVLPPVVGDEVERTIDLQYDDLSVRQCPRAVQVASSTVSVDPGVLSLRRRQTRPTAQPPDIELGERLRAAGDVKERESQLPPVPQLGDLQARLEQAGRGR